MVRLKRLPLLHCLGAQWHKMAPFGVPAPSECSKAADGALWLQGCPPLGSQVPEGCKCIKSGPRREQWGIAGSHTSLVCLWAALHLAWMGFSLWIRFREGTFVFVSKAWDGPGVLGSLAEPRCLHMEQAGGWAAQVTQLAQSELAAGSESCWEVRREKSQHFAFAVFVMLLTEMLCGLRSWIAALL